MVKPKLLILELWGMGDLAIATPFLSAASTRFHVTVAAKPYAFDFQARFWPEVNLVVVNAPWTVFRGKYRFHHWPWKALAQILKGLRREKFDLAASARWDPRDHLILFLTGARQRFGFPRMCSQVFLTHSLTPPAPSLHRYDFWRMLAKAVDVDLPERRSINAKPRRAKGSIVVHTGAAQTVRVWPLERFAQIILKLRAKGLHVQVLCDPPQLEWWRKRGEITAAAPATVRELLAHCDQARLFIGNDSGPGHAAALCGLPTFTIFGPQLPELFLPIHPEADFIPGKECPYKPCFDYCRFPEPHCLLKTSTEEAWSKIEHFVAKMGG